MRAPSRKKVEQWPWHSGYVKAVLSCGHELLIESYSRLSKAKTLSCWQCTKSKR